MAQETADKFAELASARVTKVIQAIRRLRSLANPSSYNYSESDVKAIFAAIADELQRVHEAYQQGLKGKRVPIEKPFTLKR